MAAAHPGSSSAAAAGEAPTTGEHRMGTTIIGVCYEGGVILGADSRTSTGTASGPSLSAYAAGDPTAGERGLIWRGGWGWSRFSLGSLGIEG
jgi:hypothetical protein